MDYNPQEDEFNEEYDEIDDEDDCVFQYTAEEKGEAFAIFEFGEAIIACTSFVLFIFLGYVLFNFWTAFPATFVEPW